MKLNKHRVGTLLLLFLLLLVGTTSALAQDDDNGVSVDDIAAKLHYENTMSVTNYEPSACVQWRAANRPTVESEITRLLAEGKTEEQVIYEFVSCFGYRVIGMTDDEVNDIAEKLYCPVCENIPLETCGTAACRDWRNEIGIYLANGMTEDEIVSEFVRKFGDRVSSTPQDPTLRILSLVTPWVLVGFMFAAAAYTYVRLTNQTDKKLAGKPSRTKTEEIRSSDDDYLARLEKDLDE